MYEFKLPDLGEGIHEAEIVRWYVQVGEPVGKDANLVEVETDKATVAIPSPVAGKLAKVAGQMGDTVHVGQMLALIETDEQVRPTPPAPAGKIAAAPAAPAAPAAQAAPARIRRDGPVPAAPATRQLARDLNVDINTIPGTGPAGRVTPEDVHRQAAGQRPFTEGRPAEVDEPIQTTRLAVPPTGIPLLSIEPLPDFSRFGPVQVEPLRSIRRKTARRMTNAWLQIPHVSHFDDADVTNLEAFRQRNRQRMAEQAGAPLTLLAFTLKAVTRALRKFPQFNASVDALREEIITKRYYNIGVAVATERGLIVPVVRETDRKSLVEIAAAVADLATRGRDNQLTSEDFQGATFTVTNMGPVGGTAATPIINHPEVAILAIMRAVEKPVVRDGQIVIRRIMPLILSFDHRVIDGADAAAFVNEIVRLLGDPDSLLLES